MQWQVSFPLPPFLNGYYLKICGFDMHTRHLLACDDALDCPGGLVGRDEDVVLEGLAKVGQLAEGQVVLVRRLDLDVLDVLALGQNQAAGVVNGGLEGHGEDTALAWPKYALDEVRHHGLPQAGEVVLSPSDVARVRPGGVHLGAKAPLVAGRKKGVLVLEVVREATLRALEDGEGTELAGDAKPSLPVKLGDCDIGLRSLLDPAVVVLISVDNSPLPDDLPDHCLCPGQYLILGDEVLDQVDRELLGAVRLGPLSDDVHGVLLGVCSDKLAVVVLSEDAFIRRRKESGVHAVLITEVRGLGPDHLHHADLGLSVRVNWQGEVLDA
mmetsp:Transcript_17588/g.35737  ORF Transcript_17588/g.35737 Transcript_17588/m.35737 type:complete len:326 (-) Transcript_17588:113-1090(-)